MAPGSGPFRPRLTPATLDTWLVRRSIAKALWANLHRLSGTVLDVGCGFKPYRGPVLASPSRAQRYVGLDLWCNAYGLPDLAWDGRSIPLSDGSVDGVLLTEVLEHCTDPGSVLSECRRVLRPGGIVFVTIPFLWPLHEVPRDEQRLTPFALDRLLRTAGLVIVEMKALGGWDAALAQMLGLWVRRRMSGTAVKRALRTVLSPLLWPVIAALSHLDVLPHGFHEGTMITGLAAVATKPSTSE
jgi:SAM-dependent methyltransferase